MSYNEQVLERYSSALLDLFGQPALVLTSGKAAKVTDINGKEYLDLLAGIAVNALGHAHPAWLAALAEQAQKLVHISNFFTSQPQIDLAHRLLELLDSPQPARVFFSNSGTEANELAYKLARRHANLTGKTKLLALENGFHGRSLGALSLTHKPSYRQPFEPLPTGIKHIPANLAALEAAMDDQVAAIILEPIQGEAGVLELEEGYLIRARQLSRQHGALLIIYEVQTGIDRTGRWFESSRELNGENLADVITLAKGLGGGFPIGACIVNGKETLNLLAPGMHGSTFGGNPLATAVALATINTLDREQLLDKAAALGRQVRSQLETLERVQATSGAGLLIGIELTDSQTSSGAALGPACVKEGLKQGFIFNATGASRLRIAPPLVITDQQLNSFVQALPHIVERASQR